MLFLGHNTNGKLFQLLLFTSKLLPPFLLQETHEISLSSDKSSSAGKYYIYEKTNDYVYEIKMIWNVSCFTCLLLAYTNKSQHLNWLLCQNHWIMLKFMTPKASVQLYKDVRIDKRLLHPNILWSVLVLLIIKSHLFK